MNHATIHANYLIIIIRMTVNNHITE